LNDPSAEPVPEPLPESSLTGFERAGLLADLEDGLPQGVVLSNGERVCVVRRGHEVWAVHDVCPHRAFALSGGDTLTVDGESAPVIECPWHGAQFSCATGAVLQGPATDALPTFPVRIVEGEVFIGARREPFAPPEVV
jgi:3-phenylpropionate/trans-cinnamate dioxygenase ferredoxin subunit